MRVRPRESRLAHFTPTPADRQLHHNPAVLSVRVSQFDVNIAVVLDSNLFHSPGHAEPVFFRDQTARSLGNSAADALPGRDLRRCDGFDVGVTGRWFRCVGLCRPTGNAVISLAGTWRSKTDRWLRV